MKERFLQIITIINILRQVITNFRQFLKDEHINLSLKDIIILIIVVKAAKYLFVYCLLAYPIKTIVILLQSLFIFCIGIYITNKFML
jgi:hypothetical protein